jgi:hypothetical protein
MALFRKQSIPKNGEISGYFSRDGVRLGEVYGYTDHLYSEEYGKGQSGGRVWKSWKAIASEFAVERI